MKKKRIVKKIANAYLRGRWWNGTKEPYFWPVTSDGEGYIITEARLPLAVKAYFKRQALDAYHPWFDGAHVVKIEWFDGVDVEPVEEWR